MLDNEKIILINPTYTVYLTKEIRATDEVIGQEERNGVKNFLYRHEYEYHIMSHYNIDGDNRERDFFWIKQPIVNVWFLKEWFDNDCISNGCYAVIILGDDLATLIDVIRPKDHIIENFKLSSYKGARETFIERRTNNSYFEYSDYILTIWDKEDKEYALFSLLKRSYVFGPYKYNEIIDLKGSVLLDNCIYVEDDGTVVDLTGYDCISKPEAKIYCNKELKKYYMLLLEDETGLYEARKDINFNSLSADVTEWHYVYYLHSGELERFELDNIFNQCDQRKQWEEYSDIAYEGYSREWLGLD